MTANERFRDVIDYLIASRRVRNQQHFTEEIHSEKTTVSRIKNGKVKIPPNVLANIETAFPEISTNWLKTGEGEMLISIGSEKPLLYANMTLRQYYAGLFTQGIIIAGIPSGVGCSKQEYASHWGVQYADFLLNKLAETE